MEEILEFMLEEDRKELFLDQSDRGMLESFIEKLRKAIEKSGVGRDYGPCKLVKVRGPNPAEPTARKRSRQRLGDPM